MTLFKHDFQVVHEKKLLKFNGVMQFLVGR